MNKAIEDFILENWTNGDRKPLDSGDIKVTEITPENIDKMDTEAWNHIRVGLYEITDGMYADLVRVNNGAVFVEESV